MAHLVTGALAVVRDRTGRTVYLYQGGYVPDGLADADELDRLTRLGLLTKVAALDPDPAPVADDDGQGNDGSQSAGTAAGGAPAPLRPPMAAAKGIWVQHVVELAEHHGDDTMTRERAEAMSKDQLIAYTPPA